MHGLSEFLMYVRLLNESVTLSVSEIFGPTIQGEGPSQGRPVVFLRLGLCNLDCAWCDTPFTWDWTGKNGTKYDKTTELTKMNVVEVMQRLEALTAYPARLVVSGNEPLIQQRRLADVVRAWSPRPVEIETNGTMIPDEGMTGVQFNCSPKLSNSGIDYDRRIVPEALTAIAQRNSTFKFVVTSEDDLNEVRDIHETHLPDVDPGRVYLMPEGIHADDLLKALPTVMMQAAELGYSVSPRLHALAFGDRRGI